MTKGKRDKEDEFFFCRRRSTSNKINTDSSIAPCELLKEFETDQVVDGSDLVEELLPLRCCFCGSRSWVAREARGR